MATASRCLLLLVVAAAPVLAQQADDPDIKSRIIALEHLSRVQAWKSKDVKTLDKLLDGNFLYVNAEGKLQTKPEFLASVQSVDIVDYRADSITVRTHSDTAIATGIYQIRELVRGKVSVQRARFVDTWLLKGSQWLVIASLSTPTE